VRGRARLPNPSRGSGSNSRGRGRLGMKNLNSCNLEYEWYHTVDVNVHDSSFPLIRQNHSRRVDNLSTPPGVARLSVSLMGVPSILAGERLPSLR
jgi:hypothetical protein